MMTNDELPSFAECEIRGFPSSAVPSPTSPHEQATICIQILRRQSKHGVICCCECEMVPQIWITLGYDVVVMITQSYEAHVPSKR